MLQTKVKGLIIKTVDIAEFDKLIIIFTAEMGKIVVKSKGVRKNNAKFKAFCQPFCFAEFEITESKNGYATLTGVNAIDSFFDISLDYDKYYLCCKILNLLDNVCRDNQQDVNLFMLTISFLNNVVYSDIKFLHLVCKYLIDFIDIEGFALNIGRCCSCGKKYDKKIFFDYDCGQMFCNSCKSSDAVEMLPTTYSTLKIFQNIETGDKLNTLNINDGIIKQCIYFLVNDINIRFDTKLKIDF